MAYQGSIINVPVGQIGLVTDKSPPELPLGALIEAKNISLDNGVVQKAPGTLIYNTNDQLDGAIVAVFDWHPKSHLQRLIAATATGKIYRDTGDRTFNSATAITTDLGVLTPNSMFVEAGNESQGNDKKLCFFSNGTRQVQVLSGDGITFSTMSNPASDWVTPNFPTVGITHRQRLWAFMDQRAYASDTADHENFTSNFLTQSIYPGEGGDIIGAFVFKGRLFVFKEGDFIYYLEESASDSSTWYWKKLSSNFGLSAPNAIINALDDMLAGNASGTVTSYSAADTFGDIESADIMRIMEVEQYIRSTYSKSGIGEMHAIYYQERKQAFFTYRSTYKNSNDMLIVLDANKQQPRITTWVKGSPVCLGLRKNIENIRVPMYGSLDGYVHIMDYEDRLEGAAAYEGAFQTTHMDFRQADPSLASRQKHFDFLWLEFIEEGNFNVSIDVIIDGKFIETVTVPMQAQGNYLDEFLLDTDYLGHRTTQSDPIPLKGTGRKISFRIYNSGSSESFQITSLAVGFRSGADSAVRF
jgi:hypothetical protein